MHPDILLVLVELNHDSVSKIKKIQRALWRFQKLTLSVYLSVTCLNIDGPEFPKITYLKEQKHNITILT